MADRPKRLALDDLHKVVATLPPDIKADDGGRTAALANTIIARFLGKSWFAKHIRHDAQKVVSSAMISHLIGGGKPVPSE
jgi:hypothetical protein